MLRRSGRGEYLLHREWNLLPSIHDLRFSVGLRAGAKLLARESVKRFLTRRVTGGLHAPISFCGSGRIRTYYGFGDRVSMYVCFAG